MTDADGPARESVSTLIVREPDTGEEIGTVPVMSAEEVAEMARRGREAGRRWADAGVDARVAGLRRLRRLLADRSDRAAEVVARETAKSPAEAYLTEVMLACDQLAWVEKAAPRVLGERRWRTLGPGTHRGRVRFEPYGLAGIITPWNFPLVITVSAVASALAAGNAALLKPSQLTPYSSLLLEELAEEALPDPDLVQVATGDDETGKAVVEAPVDVLSFTGGTETGRKVLEAAAQHLTPVILELGGKDAMIVLDDADVERAARGAVWGACFHSGQICQAVERAYVQRPLYDRFVQLAVEEAEALRIGRRDSGAELHPLTQAEQIEVIEAHVGGARREGATVLTGGRRLPGPGVAYAPTVVVDVTPEMRIMREETFGPVLAVVPFDDVEEAVRMANDTRYGLDAYVWTGDRQRGRRLARRLKAGSVMLNDVVTNYGLPELPFGGVGDSGFGRIHGEEGLRSFARTASLAEPRFPRKRELHWFPGPEKARWARALVKARHGSGLAGRLSGIVDALRGWTPGAGDE